VQYHPEASPGPHDSHFLFTQFHRPNEGIRQPGELTAMRALVPALGCLLVAANASIACSVVRVVETLPSSPTSDSPLFAGQYSSAECDACRQFTDKRPTTRATTEDGRSRQCRVAEPGSRHLLHHCHSGSEVGADLCLVVSKGHDRERSEFSLKLTPLPPTPPTLAEQLGASREITTTGASPRI